MTLGSRIWKLFDDLAEQIDRRYGWHRLPAPLGLAVLAGLRDRLRKNNLYDTGRLPATSCPVPPAPRRTARGKA